MDYEDLTVIIPTINEAENIGVLLRTLAKRYRGVSAIVTDDGSTDGTKELVMELGRKNRRVRFLDRSGAREHGPIASMVDAAMRVKTPYLVIMDGDLQHPPAKIAEIHALLKKNDFVVGVRTRIKNWELHRRILSKGAISLARIVFFLRGRRTVSDMMSGFLGIRTRLLQSLIHEHRDGFLMHGGKMVLDILRLLDNDARIAEVPYSNFTQRREGKSKYFGIRQILYVLISIIR